MNFTPGVRLPMICRDGSDVPPVNGGESSMRGGWLMNNVPVRIESAGGHR